MLSLGSSIGPLQISRRFGMPSVIAYLLAGLLAVQNVTAQNLPAQDHASRGISLAREGKLPEAEQELRDAVHSAPRVASYRAQLGSILGLQEKWNEALEAFQQAIDLTPENLDFRRETAAVQWQLGLMSSAEKNLQYVLREHPDDPGAILLLGLVKEKTGDYRKASELLDSQFSLVSLQPDRIVALFHSITQSGQHDQVPKIVEVLKLHASDTQWASAVSRCAQIAVGSGDMETAEAVFALLSIDNPERAVAGVQVAKLLYSRGQIPQAQALISQLIEHGVASADLEALLGNCLEAERQPDLALQAYQRAIQLAPSQIDHYEDLISLLLYMRRADEAATLVKKALQLAPRDARAWVWKGDVDLNRNAYKDAMESYRHAVTLDTSNADARFGVSAAFFFTGQADAVIAECKAGIKRFPNDSRFYVAYAEMLIASPDSINLQNQARDLLEKAVQLSPQSAQARYLLGQLALQEGRFKEAETEFLLSLQTDPDRSKTHFALAGIYRRTGRADDAAREMARYQELKQVEESGRAAATSVLEKP
jgi:tetratricopeptide (TPR) repeat protein